jgi:hypothetical protein
MPKKLNLIGQTFGRLTVIGEGELYISPGGRSYSTSICRCECGVTKQVVTGSLIRGKTRSCGCLRKQLMTTHGQLSAGKRSKEYKCWNSIKSRCLNCKHKQFKNYGGRGITICDEWLNSFETFLKDMGLATTKAIGLAPSKAHSLDRIDNARGYSKENCRWATNQQQAINQRVRCDNTSGVKGVYWDEKSNKWIARISINRKRKNLGSFLTKEDAIAARLKAEEEYYKPLVAFTKAKDLEVL